MDSSTECLASSFFFLQLATIVDKANKANLSQSSTELSLLSSLQTLNQNNNSLEGEILANLSHCSSLTFLGLANNNLVGKVPREFNFPSKLKHLVIQKNNLTGGIPSFLMNLTALEVISAAQNAFNRSIPDELGHLRNISYFALGEKNLSGRNSLFGSLPSEVGNQKNLAELDISENKLSGDVPSTLGSCTSHQNLSLEGNLLQESIPSSLSSLREEKESWSYGSLLRSFMKGSYKILLKATEGFSSENLIGVGGFASVYKGILDQDGSIVAVKVFNLKSRGASKSFLAECETLRNIRHRKLIKIITACSTIDFQGNDFKALVYEFMPNGSLKKWLHSSLETDNREEKQQRLNLLQRINITIDVACALDYLHHHCQTLIIHCDLKPRNVLLDHDMTTHVGDFGLARFHTKLSNPNHNNSIGVRGTIG
ncbi:receptor kinase-like protein Xa21 [Camellia sinensis]|uniref:receptor kinase-like protein Xa21 n=1 Tax=Camellia sinensis TaxID=4442 RepID=UPI0010367F2C|nr:receptor kinase-like protein Xa21 [Camellia sinensis]